jgi:hypothetical protein
MGLLSRILGTEEAPQVRAQQRLAAQAGDAEAIERYRYMVQTAPPETLEQAHAEAFAKLTPEQRQLLLRELAQTAPPEERAALERTSNEDPRALARFATRAEIRQPGAVERALDRPSMGLGSGLLSSFVAGFAGSMVAQSFFSSLGGIGDAGATEAGPADTGDTSADTDANQDDLGLGDDFGGDDFGGEL